jgi:hypothetical protein
MTRKDDQAGDDVGAESAYRRRILTAMVQDVSRALGDGEHIVE